MRHSRGFPPKVQRPLINVLPDGSLRFDSPYDAALVAAFKANIPHADRKPHYVNGKWQISILDRQS
jgi:hypothetical protein